MDEIEDLEEQTGDLARRCAEASETTRAFGRELGKTGDEMAKAKLELTGLKAGFSSGVRSAIDSVVLDGGRLSDALGMLGDAMSRTAYNAAMRPVSDHLGGLLSNGVNAVLGGAASAFGSGGSFTQDRVEPFAKGGVVSGATVFPMRGGTGLMGEAGPEAIMPLTRTADGRLGVAAQAGGGVTVTMNITTPDVAGFRRSQSQIAAQMARAIGQGARNR